MNRLTLALAAVVMVTVLGGTVACGSEDSAEAPADPIVDLSRLDVGNNPTQPTVWGKANPDQARLLEGIRLGNQLPLPSEIDPGLKYVKPEAEEPHDFIRFNSPGYLSVSAPAGDRTDAEVKGLVCGFTTFGQTDPTPGLSLDVHNAVMMFDTEQNAADAAERLAQIDRDASADLFAGIDPPLTDTSIPVGRFPAAHTQSTDLGTLQSWYATGRYVITTYVDDEVMTTLRSRDLSRLIPYVEKSIEANSRAVQDFSPTPPDQMNQVEIDPDGMLSRTLPTAAADQSNSGGTGVYNRHGALQVSTAPESDARLFEDTGVDRVSWNGDYLYRARDAAGARRVAQQQSKPDRQTRSVEPPPGLPQAHCRGLKNPDSRWMNYYCTVSFDRYATTVSTRQLTDAHQRISAQYAILANSR